MLFAPAAAQMSAVAVPPLAAADIPSLNEGSVSVPVSSCQWVEVLLPVVAVEAFLHYLTKRHWTGGDSQGMNQVLRMKDLVAATFETRL